MKKIESGKDLNKLDGVVYELYQLNALIGFMQVAFAEGPSATDEEEAAALMGAKGWTIFNRVTFPHIKWAFLYGVVLCTARAMGEFGAVSVLSGHLRGKTNTLPLHVEILYNEFQYVPAFAVSSILVILAVILLIARNVLEHKGKGEKGDVR